jgi:hypothetical protein
MLTATFLTPLSHASLPVCCQCLRLVSAGLISARLVSAVTWVSSGVVAVVAGSVCVRAAFALASLAFSFGPAHADTQTRRFQEAQACIFLSLSLSLLLARMTTQTRRRDASKRHMHTP